MITFLWCHINSLEMTGYFFLNFTYGIIIIISTNLSWLFLLVENANYKVGFS